MMASFSRRLSVNSLFCLCTGLALVAAQSTEYCYSKDTSPNRLYASKTAYRAAHGDEVVRNESVTGCQVSNVYLLARHGSRYEERPGIERMTSFLPTLQSEILGNNNTNLCDEDLRALESWSMRMKVEDAFQLAQEGLKEMQEMGQNVKTRFPAPFLTPYSNTSYLFRGTRKPRAHDSVIGLIQGIFGSSDGVQLEPEPERDDLLRFYDNCALWKQTSADVEEDRKFKAGEVIQNVVNQINAKINKTLSLDDILLIYDNCRFEYMIYDNAPWCALFDSDMLRALEYREDIRAYWTGMYGNAVNYEQACPLVKDILNNFDLFLKDKQPVSVNRVTHITTMQMFYARIGIFRDETPIRADNYAQQTNRATRVSDISPMAANIQFALYDCGNNYQVRTFANGDELELPGCPSPCNLETLRRQWQPIADTCDLEKICKVPDTLNVATVNPPIAGMIVVLLLTCFFS